jgi:hypothetical protein
LDVVGSTRGTVLYRGVSSWSPLLPGSANDILSSGGAGADPSWQSISATLDTTAGSSQGSLLYRNASTWTALPPGTSGQILQTNGGGANPSWATIAGSGTVTQVNTGTGLTGGPITISGTVSIANTGVAAGSYGTTSAVPTLTVNAQGQITSATDTAIAIATSQITSGTLGIDRGGTGLSSVPTNGQIDIGNGTGFTRTTLTASTGISISNGAGSISISNSGVLSFSAGTTGLTPSTGTTGTVTLAGTLNVANGGTGATSLTGYVYGNGTGAFTASTTIPNSGLQNSSLTIGSTAISLGNTASSIAGLTSLTLTQDPINPLDAATKQYVDSTIEGLNIHAPAAAATTANLTATYNNGTSGVGATLTNSGAQAAFAVDGYTAALNDRILVKNQSTAAQNGVYTVTTVGSGSTNWVLTRATDMNVSGSGADQLGPGDYVFVVNGTQNAGTAWVVTTPLPITIGSTSITFVQFAGASTYTAGTGLTLTGTQFSITNTGVSAASYGSASSVPAITINAQGQITSATDTAIAISASQITSGSLGVARGGTGTSTAFTAGSLVFAGASGVYSQDNANLFWDDSNNYLGIGTATPAAPLNVSVSTSGDAVRITQTGAGNALVVEDSTNPDATPFVVNASGQVLIGRTTAPFGSTSLAIEQSAADSAPSNIDFLKNRAGAIVNSGDGLGRIRFWGYDGAAPIAAAEIVAAVDGTPGTNDMPGRLVFSTTADGASTATERMRIDNIGRIGINSTALTGYQFRIAGTYTSTDVNPIWLGVNGTIPSTATGQAYGFFSGTATQAATFTLTGLNHFFASQGGVGAGSTLTNQYGFRANSNLTGATNNYGFYSDIASGTGRWNFYAAGTADNYFAGQVQLGAGTVAAPALSTTGDTNTGIFFPAADTIAFSEGGVESMRIDSSGNVGIGTSSPTATLNVVANTSSDALRITQTGAGNALVVEDSANPDATPFVVDANGRVISGYTSSQSIGADIPNIQTNAGSSTNNGYGTINWTGSTGSSNFNFAKSRSTTIGTPSIVLSGDSLGKTKFFGDDGVGFIEAARIEAAVDGTPGTNDMPGRLVFSTTADGASTPTERMRINNAGNVGIGTTSPGSKLEVNQGILTVNTSDQSLTRLQLKNTGVSGRTWELVGGLPGTDNINFSIYDNTAAATRLTIGSSGQLGIGGANYGTSGQVLTSNGSAAAPSWQAAATTGVNFQSFTSTGTWTKPAGYAAGSRAFIQLWGGGAGGGKNGTNLSPGGGGAGGSYVEIWVALSALGATETVTIGAGGAAGGGTGGAGGNTTFGSILTAYGGGGGFGSSGGGGGGGGGGQLSAGAAGASGVGGAAGQPWQNDGGTCSGVAMSQGGANGNAGGHGFWAGGGGGGPFSGTAGAGGKSYYGGGGGGGGGTSAGGAGGTSVAGGAGGAGTAGGVATAGSQPGGGGGGAYGGTAAAGAAGQCLITIFPA